MRSSQGKHQDVSWLILLYLLRAASTMPTKMFRVHKNIDVALFSECCQHNADNNCQPHKNVGVYSKDIAICCQRTVERHRTWRPGRAGALKRHAGLRGNLTFDIILLRARASTSFKCRRCVWWSSSCGRPHSCAWICDCHYSYPCSTTTA